jgi:hypothetical protein
MTSHMKRALSIVLRSSAHLYKSNVDTVTKPLLLDLTKVNLDDVSNNALSSHSFFVTKRRRKA